MQNLSIHEIRRNVFQILVANEKLYENFYSRFFEIERQFRNLPEMEILKYDFPYKDDCYITVNIENNEYNYCKVRLHIRDKEYILGEDNSQRRNWEQGELFDKIIEKERLSFAPKANDEFIQEIYKLEKGKILNLNERMGLICVNKNDNEIILKKQWTGSLASVDINSFKDSETFYINKDNLLDIQYLFSKAYDYRSNAANIRVNINSDSGYHCLTDFETQIENNNTEVFHAGKIVLKVSKINDKCIWYDVDNNIISRDTVATIFGWAKESLMNYRITEFYQNDIAFNQREIRYTNNDLKLISTLQLLSYSHNFEEIITHAHLYSLNTNAYSTINISGLIAEEKGFSAKTYVFYTNPKTLEKRIYELSYNNNDFNSFVTDFKEVSKENFIKICEQKYDEKCQQIKAYYEPIIGKYMGLNPNASKEELQRKFVMETIEKMQRENPDYNPLEISRETFNHISKNAEQLISSYLDERLKKEKENIQVTELINDDFNER